MLHTRSCDGHYALLDTEISRIRVDLKLIVRLRPQQLCVMPFACALIVMYSPSCTRLLLIHARNEGADRQSGPLRPSQTVRML